MSTVFRSGKFVELEGDIQVSSSELEVLAWKLNSLLNAVLPPTLSSLRIDSGVEVKRASQAILFGRTGNNSLDAIRQAARRVGGIDKQHIVGIQPLDDDETTIAIGIQYIAGNPDELGQILYEIDNLSID